MSEVVTVTVSEKGELIIPRRVRERMKLKKGDKVMIAMERGRKSKKKIQDDFSDLLKASESSLGFWDNESDEVWNDV